MIYTVTFNPAIDYMMHIDSLNKASVNRSRREELYFGGKGINVSRVLKELDTDSVALGFVAGFTGRAIEDGLTAQGIKTDFVRLESGNSRINVKIKAENETEINGQGPEITEDDVKKLFEKLDCLKAGDVLVLAGSIPRSLPADMYEKILERFCGKEVDFVVDASGELLVNTLKYRPFLIKPNCQELGEIFGKNLQSNEEIIECAKALQDKGAKNVLVSLAQDGAILADEDKKIHTVSAPKGELVNSVGAGDSMVAGFLAGYIKSGDYQYGLSLGIAAGSATAFSCDLAKKDEILKIFNGAF